MKDYPTIDEVSPGLSFGNSGQSGWSCMFYSDAEEPPHRDLLQALAGKHPEAVLKLPPYESGEDCVSGTLIWAGRDIHVYYEMILALLTLWSEDREAVESARKELINVWS